MRTIKIGSHIVELYDAIDEMPIKRFHKYNKMLLVDAGIGSDLADFDGHIQKAIAYLKAKAPENAIVELDNLRQNVFMMQNEVSPRSLAFACLVKAVDGKPTEATDEALSAIVEKLADVPLKEMTAHFDAVKKKIDSELQLYFPTLFEDASVKEYFDQMKRRTLAQLDIIINGANERNTSDVERLTLEMLTYNKPRMFSGSDNTEIQHDKNFERMCVTISHHLHIDAKNYTILEFYNAFEYVKELLKAKEKTTRGK